MFFLCFSGKDRLTIVQSILYHLQKFGLDVWYDNYEHILGDNKEVNYIQGISRCRYAVVIFSPSFAESPGAIEELKIIRQRYNEDLIRVFPVFYNITATAVPGAYSWLCDLIYNELNDSTGTMLSCNQMICKFFADQLFCQRYRTLWEMRNLSGVIPPYAFSLLERYWTIIPENINSRLTSLYCLFLFFQSLTDLPQYLIKTADYIFLSTRLNLEYNFKEIIIMEQDVCLAVNQYVTDNQLKSEG